MIYWQRTMSNTDLYKPIITSGFIGNLCLPPGLLETYNYFRVYLGLTLALLETDNL